MLRDLLPNFRNLEEAGLDEFENLSVIKAGRNFNIFVSPQPFFERSDSFGFVGCEIVPSVEDRPPVVIARDIDAVPSIWLVAVADQWRHGHRVLALVKRVVWVGSAGLGDVFVILELVEVLIERKFFVKA